MKEKSRPYLELKIKELVFLYLDRTEYRDKAMMKLNTLMSEYSFYYNF